MNEEEIMDIIKGKLLMTKRMLEEDDNDGHASAYEMQSEDFEAIQGLLDLYNKEKEKNEKLERQMGKDLDIVYIKGIYDERDKWENKIKAKIEEYDDEINQLRIDRNVTFDSLIYRNSIKKDALQELLEEVSNV